MRKLIDFSPDLTVMVSLIVDMLHRQLVWIAILAAIVLTMLTSTIVSAVHEDVQTHGSIWRALHHERKRRKHVAHTRTVRRVKAGQNATAVT